MKRIVFSVLVHTPVTFEPFDEPAGVTIAGKKCVTYFDSEGLSLLTIGIEIGRDFAAPILCAWLYDRFVKNPSHKSSKDVKINERTITYITRDEFLHAVEREIQQSETQDD
jgi:hypothetical protein